MNTNTKDAADTFMDAFFGSVEILHGEHSADYLRMRPLDRPTTEELMNPYFDDEPDQWFEVDDFAADANAADEVYNV